VRASLLWFIGIDTKLSTDAYAWMNIISWHVRVLGKHHFPRCHSKIETNDLIEQQQRVLRVFHNNVIVPHRGLTLFPVCTKP
jgi:hypothetical protein